MNISNNFSALLAIKDESSSDTVISLLNSFFTNTKTVHSGQEALDLYKSERFDVIYFDLDLPNMRGLNIIKNIKNCQKNSLFILFVSAEDTDQLYDLIILDIFAFIAKPVIIKNFTQITRYVIKVITQNHLNSMAEQRKLHDQLTIQQQKLLQTGEMISMIAHQWRQPLSAITTIIGTLRTQLNLDFYKKSADPYKALEKDLYSAFGKIEESATFLSKTINDFRNFYSPNNAQSEFNVADLIERVCRMVLIDKELHNITLTLDLDRSIVLKTYESELMQVLMNLLNNARDAFKEKGIENSKILISLKQGEKEVYLDIVDNAKGIPKDIMDKIFLPYFSTKTLKNGTGIGLHMSKTIIENHMNGSIKVTNCTLYEGADFCITLPKKTPGYTQ